MEFSSEAGRSTLSLNNKGRGKLHCSRFRAHTYTDECEEMKPNTFVCGDAYVFSPFVL